LCDFVLIYCYDTEKFISLTKEGIMKKLQIYTLIIEIFLKINQTLTKKLEQNHTNLINKQITMINKKSYK
jgi:hypothetical protein